MIYGKRYAVVFGAGGFIGGHLMEKLKNEGYYVVGSDLKANEYRDIHPFCDELYREDLRDFEDVEERLNANVDEVYQLAADMGGAGYIFSGENDADVMHNSAQINLNVLEACKDQGIKDVFYSSSACIYPEYNQMDPNNPKCSEESAYPAEPDSEYGWEKLFSERLYFSYNRNYGMNCKVARFHNIFGPYGAWNNGKEKAPAAICRKVALAKDGESVEVWGTGEQTRSFLHVDECVEGVRRLMQSDFNGPVNIGSEEMISIADFTKMVIEMSGKNLDIKYIDGPTGVNGRNSDNSLLRKYLDWEPSMTLKQGIRQTYDWIDWEAYHEDLKD